MNRIVKLFKDKITTLPFLVLVFFVLRFYQYKIIDFTYFNFGEIVILILFVGGGILFSQYLIMSLLRDKLKSSLLISLTISILFISKQIFEQEIKTYCMRLNVLNSLSFYFIFLFILFLLIAVLFYKIRFVKISEKFHNYLITISIIFIIIEVLPKTQTIDKDKVSLLNQVKFESNYPIEQDTLPNIYYLIFDSYTSFSSLEKYWHYQNKDFSDSLKNIGFSISTESKSNYNHTLFSMASSLNMSYINYNPNFEMSNKLFSNLAYLIKNSVVANYFNKHNYKILNFSFLDLVKTPAFYEDYMLNTKNALSKKQKYLNKTTELFENIFVEKETRKKTMGINNIIFDKLKDSVIRFEDRRIFLYGHFIMPHFPYDYNSTGEIMDDSFALDVWNKDNYLEYLKYSNHIILETVKTIIALDKKSVVILQGDHGFRYLEGIQNENETFSILYAIYSSNRLNNELYNTISPVNTFRIILSTYCNEKIPLLYDSTYNVFSKIWVKIK